MIKKSAYYAFGIMIFFIFICFNISNATTNKQTHNIESKNIKLAQLDSKTTQNNQSTQNANLQPAKKYKNFDIDYGGTSSWQLGDTFLGFLDKNHIPQSLYYNLSPEDKEIVADIYAGSLYYIYKDANDKITSVYVPVNEYTQIEIYLENNEYKLSIVPLISTKVSHKLSIKIQSNPYNDIIKVTNDYALANEFLVAYKNNVNFKKSIKKGSVLSIFYDRKYRSGKYIGTIDIAVANIDVNGHDNYVFGYKNKYYDISGKEITNLFLVTPVKYRRISSKFSYGRKHPVLGYVRPHYGVDFATNIGTPVHAAANGKISFSGTKGGYGKVVIISHADGITTLYAHLSRIAKISKVNRAVKQGSVIGYVGSTGMSTGPHLHFGMYKNNKPLNPLGRIKTAKSALAGEEKKQYLKIAKNYEHEMEEFITQNKDLVNSKDYILQIR